jgi:poly(A) polymerase
VREGRGVSPGFLFATLLWHEVLATWKAGRAGGGKSIPALFEAMDTVLAQQAKKIAIPRRFEATIKEIWSLQPRFEQRSGQRPYRLLQHPRFRAGWDFLDLRCRSGELEGDIADLAAWWDRFADAGTEERETMLKPDEGPKRKSRGRGRGRKRAPAAAALPDGDPPPGEV